MAISEGKQLSLVCEGYALPTPSEYTFEWKTVFVTENKRSNTGKMTFSEKFFVPYITISYNYLTFDQFCAIMQLSRENQVSLSYYDTWYDIQRESLFTILQPDVGTYEPWRKPHPTARGYLNVSLIFDGTNNDIKRSAVVYNSNGGSGVLPPQFSGYGGDTFVVGSGSGLSKAGYVFVGWNSATDGSGTSYSVGNTYTLVSDLVLYAEWVIGYVVSFDVDGGSPIAAQRVASGYAAKTPSEPTKSGYEFAGWYADSQFTTEYLFSEVVTADTTICAKWVAE